jgi:hypothetical protein
MTALATLMRKSISFLRLLPAARAEVIRDRAGSLPEDPGCDRVIDAGLGWLGCAQDNSRTHDGGVARHYSLRAGWSASYPETTGYIVPTMLAGARLRGRTEYRDRARRMLDWLVSIQLPSGGFQGGMVDQEPVVPVTFNTGQILMGLAAGVREFGEPYLEPMRRAADWLTATQDPDGGWRRFASPFAAPGLKVYETHVAWGLLEAARARPEPRYVEAALRNVHWALSHQRDNGWFAYCCLDDPDRPLTHTLGYVLRGIVETYLETRDRVLLDAARRTADGLLGALRPDGFLPGRLGPDWDAAASWVCLTGSAQIAHCWFQLAEVSGEARYREAAQAANRFVRRTVRVEGPAEVRGAVKGSWPVQGGYGTLQYLNWACKFLVDSCVFERESWPSCPPGMMGSPSEYDRDGAAGT